VMPDQSCSEVLRNPGALTLSDEPLTGGVEQGSMQLWMSLPDVVRTVSSSPSSTPLRGTSRSAVLDFSSLTTFGPMPTTRPRLPFAVMSAAINPQISPERMPVRSPKSSASCGTSSLAPRRILSCVSLSTPWGCTSGRSLTLSGSHGLAVSSPSPTHQSKN
jgi:hypothetical protein